MLSIRANPWPRFVSKSDGNASSMRLQTVLAAVLVAACGGGDAPIRAAQAQSAPPVETRSYLHFALRPDAAGRWRVQSDSDHASAGVLGAEQDGEFVYVLFDRRYTHAGTVIVTSDDDFSKAGISAGCNLGVTATRCVILVRGQQIEPARINEFAPVGAGNLWGLVVMVDKHSEGVEL